MKIIYLGIFVVLFFFNSVSVFAGDELKDQEGNSYEESTSKNPLTGTTTKNKKNKSVRKYKKNKHNYKAEDEVDVKEKTSSDGRKTTLERKETTTEERQ